MSEDISDPGTQGQKLSKSGNNSLEERNKSYNKVLDAYAAWHRERRFGYADIAEELHIRWKKKYEWHEKEFGW